MTGVRGGDEVKGGESALDSSVPLEASLWRLRNAVAGNLGGFHLPVSVDVVVREDKVQSHFIIFLSSELEVDMLTAVLTTDHGKSLLVRGRNLQRIIGALSTCGLEGIGGSLKGERFEVQAKAANVLVTFLDPVVDSGIFRVRVRVVGVLDIGAVVRNRRSRSGDGEHATHAESRSATAGCSTSQISAFGSGITGAVSETTTRTDCATATAWCVFEGNNVENGESFFFSLSGVI